MRGLRWIDLVAWAVMICAVLMRALGPSDLHDQTQPRTIAYSVDLALHPEHWALPVESGAVPATKPPMYNWIAAPFVRLTEGRSELAHKTPSALAFVALGAIVWSIGLRIRPSSPIGGFALLVFSTNYAWFKLGYLARPDALLSLWLIVGWMASTALIARDDSMKTAFSRRETPLKVALWISIAAAILTKGPAALVVPVYAVALGMVIELRNANGLRSRRRAATNGGRNALRLTGAWWGIPIAFAIAGAWLAAAYATNGAHVREIMLGRELVGHIVGGIGEAQESVPFDLVRTALDMPLYFLSRFLPWSVLFVAACWDLFRPPAPNLHRGFPSAEDDDDSTGRGNHEARRWIPASMLYAAVVVVFFSFAAAKRADYIASSFAPAAIVVGWWAWERGFRLGRRIPWLIPILSAGALAGLAIHDQTIGFAARYPAADAYWRFADRARPLIESDSAPLLLLETRPDPMPSLLYRNQSRSTPESVLSDLAPHQSAWIIGPSHFAEPVFTDRLAETWHIDEALAVEIPKSADPYPAYILKLYRATRR